MPKANLSYRRLAAAGVMVAAALGAALLAFSYPQRREHTVTQTSPAATRVVAPLSPRIGMGTPLTGTSATHGLQLKAGVEQAAEDINAAGGILGQKITTTIGDDRSDPKEGVQVARRFADDGVKFVVGHISTGVTIPASEVYLEHGILAITPAATNPRVTERDMWNIFRTCGRDDQQGLVAGEYILKNSTGQKIAIVHDKTTYGQGLADATRSTINSGGMKDVLYEGVNVGGRDYSTLVSRIKASGADLVYWGGLYDPGGMILRQMRDQGVKATLMGGDGITDHELAAIAGAAAQGTLLTYASDGLPTYHRRPSLGSQGRGGKIPRQEFRAVGLHALQLCGGRDHQAGGRGRQVARTPKGGRADEVRHDVQYRARRHLLRQEGRRDAARLRGLCLEEGRQR